jgi:hypothetical protein
MGYSDQKFHSRPLQLWGQAVSFGTATASATDGILVTDAAPSLPKMIRKTQINSLRLRCSVIPDTGSDVVVATFNVGGAEFGTAVLTTATADQHIDVTITTASNNVIAADGQLIVGVTGTATASADVNGSYDVWAEVQEEFV